MKRVLAVLLMILLLASCTEQPGGLPADPSPSPAGAASPSPSPSPSPEPEPSPELPSPSPIDVEEYRGPLYHAFFHFLIAYPDIAYANSYGRNLDRDCITPAEFRRSLEELYKNDFVLMNLNGYVDIAEDGTVTRKPVMVPVGKKPLILSFDDINYYSNTLGLGVCDKVVLDRDGKLAMLTVLSNGAELITYDNDVVPMLEAFCEEYPDFSPFGDKGLLSVTGYDGILGYRTQSGSPSRESEIEAVKPVVEALLDAGWYFGAHGYGHFDLEKIDLAHAESDTQKWRDEVGPLVGGTNIYLFPYGARTSWDDPRFLSLIDNGFPLLMGVGIPRAGHDPYVKHTDRYYFMDRCTIDGNTLRSYPDRLAPLLDAVTVYCMEERDGNPITAPVSTGAVDRNGDSVYHRREPVTVALGGDVMLAGSMGAMLKSGGPDAIISPELAALFRSADIAMVNLESPVSTLGEPWPGKDYAFRAEPHILEFLRDTLNVGVVSLANNHTIDYGFDAFYDTMDRLDGHGIGYTGGGPDLAGAMEPYVIEVDGVTVAFLAASQVAPNMEWYAKKNSPGLLMAYDPALITEAVKTARELYDYVIVYMHWGKEYEREPTALQVNTAHTLIDAGADAVIGSHPHCVQSFEVYKDKPIAYSLGNFLMRNYYNNTAVALLHLQDGNARLEIVPCRTDGMVYNDFASPTQMRELRDFWQSISSGAVIGQDWILR